VCNVHRIVVETAKVESDHNPYNPVCSVCVRNSVIQEAEHKSSNLVAARDEWSKINDAKKARKEHDLDYYEKNNKPYRHASTQLASFERNEIKAWIAYTLAAWNLSVQRRKQLTIDIASTATPKPITAKSEHLTKYIDDTTERSLARASGSFRDKRQSGKIYCFVHGCVGDIVMYRASHSYHECGICIDPDVKRSIKDITSAAPQTNHSSSAYMSSSASSSSSSSSYSGRGGGMDREYSNDMRRAPTKNHYDRLSGREDPNNDVEDEHIENMNVAPTYENIFGDAEKKTSGFRY